MDSTHRITECSRLQAFGLSLRWPLSRRPQERPLRQPGLAARTATSRTRPMLYAMANESMKKRASILLVAIIALGCAEQHETLPKNPPTPQWLLDRIEMIENDEDYCKLYLATRIYRHVWEGKHYYHIHSLLSSCLGCEVFESSGIKANFGDRLMEYFENRSDQAVIWEFDYERCGGMKSPYISQ